MAGKLAIKIRTEVEETASAHIALWERLDHLILTALENRCEERSEHCGKSRQLESRNY
jgi:hypothetical protein